MGFDIGKVLGDAVSLGTNLASGNIAGAASGVMKLLGDAQSSGASHQQLDQIMAGISKAANMPPGQLQQIMQQSGMMGHGGQGLPGMGGQGGSGIPGMGGQGGQGGSGIPGMGGQGNSMPPGMQNILQQLEQAMQQAKQNSQEHHHHHHPHQTQSA